MLPSRPTRPKSINLQIVCLYTDVNISFMQLSRLEPRGKALMVMALDAPLNEEQREQILDLDDVHTVKMVQL